MVVKPLVDRYREIARTTISAWGFYYMVGDAILRGEPLSVVRMADGEKKILEGSDWTSKPVDVFSKEWREKFGIDGISGRAIHERLREASRSTYFAPSTSGLTQPHYDMYGWAEEWCAPYPYVDNFYPNIWDNESKASLLRAAGHILLIHGNRGLADAMQKRVKSFFDVKLTYLEMNHWSQADMIATMAGATKAKLVLFSGGPASKCIAPRIAKTGKVVLDIGQTMESWAFHGYQPRETHAKN